MDRGRESDQVDSGLAGKRTDGREDAMVIVYSQKNGDIETAKSVLD